MSTAAAALIKTAPAGGYLASAFRATLLCLALLGLDYLIDFGFAEALLILAACSGVWLGGTLALTRLRATGLFLSHLAGLAVLWIITRVFLLLPLSGVSLLYLNHIFDIAMMVIATILLISAATWCFWKIPLIATLEVLILCLASIQAFAAHRNYRFDAAKTLNELSWKLQVHPLVTLVSIGLLLTVLIGFYFTVTSRALARDTRVARNTSYQASAGRSLPSIIVGSLLLVLILGTSSYFILQQNYSIIDSRLQNGVSDELKEGLSPLGFHSALGASSQPAALVRLENDYTGNPHSPMLYLREAALSAYKDNEMVMAAREFNPDVPILTPGTHYKSEGFPDQYERTPINHSIYLLTDHKLAFTIDYPLSIVELTTPKKTNKFKSAYRVYSMAPSFALPNLLDASVGDPNWDENTLDHFTDQHPDKRYRELALSIIGGTTNPIQQAETIVQYLNTKSIYTLTPGHEVEEGSDPTAPYLFGDMRGYCVHFAHATVYLLRSLGIPARIGTGYLTDMSQAKDGHILLRMNDRHAWAEVYISGYGWVPFDTQPEQVEVHAETPVDSTLLEELMGLLEPGEEIIPEDILADEFSEQTESSFPLLEANDFIHALLLTLFTLILAKIYFVAGWRLPGTAQQTINRGWTALSIRLADLGIKRTAGETTLEFIARINRSYATNPDALPPVLLACKYAERPSQSLDAIRNAIQRDFRALKKFPAWQRWLSFFNPFSLFIRVQIP